MIQTNSKRACICLSMTAALLGLALPGAEAQVREAGQQDWEISIWAAGATGEENSNSFAEAQIFTTGVYAGRMITGELGRGWGRGRFEFGFDIAPLFLQFTPEAIPGMAFDPVIFRWHQSRRLGRAAPFLELGGGAVYTPKNFPVGDTSTFNFIARGGGGVQIPTKPWRALEIGCRWWHISNANLGTRNPEFNGVQVSLGYAWLR